jgi:hypothetical protein
MMGWSVWIRTDGGEPVTSERSQTESAPTGDARTGSGGAGFAGAGPENPDTEWIRADGAEVGGPDATEQCVEMRRHQGMIEVRDSLDPDGAVLRFTPAEWDAWLDGARKGEFDHLVEDVPAEEGDGRVPPG